MRAWLLNGNRRTANGRQLVKLRKSDGHGNIDGVPLPNAARRADKRRDGAEHAFETCRTLNTAEAARKVRLARRLELLPNAGNLERVNKEDDAARMLQVTVDRGNGLRVLQVFAGGVEERKRKCLFAATRRLGIVPRVDERHLVLAVATAQRA